MVTIPVRRAATVVLALVVAVLVTLLVTRSGPGPAVATTTPADAAVDTVTVNGVGSAGSAPDTLGVDFQVHVTRASVQEAINAQAAATKRVIAALEHAGVPASRVRTVDVNIDRHYDNNGNVTGYDANETIHARITPIRHAGRIISAGATASGNDVEVGSVSFDIADDQALKDQARANAFADAKARAEQYATLSGRSLGRVVHVDETVSPAEPPVPYYKSYGLDALQSAAGTAAVPLAPGRQSLQVRVTVVFALS